MRLHRLLPFFITLIFIGAPISSHAEALDDASIRGLYAEENAVVDDMEKTRQLMEKRLDDGFTLQLTAIEIDNRGKPETHVETRNKKEAIDDNVKTAEVTKNVKNSGNIISKIRYSPDRKYATVTYSNTETGTLVDPGSSRQAHYDSTQSCDEKVQLLESTLKIMDAVCNDRTVINEEH